MPAVMNNDVGPTPDRLPIGPTGIIVCILVIGLALPAGCSSSTGEPGDGGPGRGQTRSAPNDSSLAGREDTSGQQAMARHARNPGKRGGTTGSPSRAIVGSQETTLPMPGQRWASDDDSPNPDLSGNGVQTDSPADRPNRLPADAGRLRPRLPEIDDDRLQAAHIRKLAGTHLILYTDLPPQPAVDELPEVFDLAVSSWCDYFDVDESLARDWKIIGYLMQRKERFQGVGRLPTNLPPFLNGYQRGSELWVYEQPSDYYRRHLLLHEGTHAFMNGFLGAAGPPWYMEGMAELLATHSWHAPKLELGYFPKSRSEVPQLGRIRIVNDQWRSGQGMTVEQILNYGPRAHLRNEPYGWCWAFSAFLEGHPQFKKRFHQLTAHVHEEPETFRKTFEGLYRSDLRQLQEQWQWFFTQLDYGFDVPRESFVYQPVLRTKDSETIVTIRADRGWQDSGIRVGAGSKWVLTGRGRFQIAADPEPWISEAGGVTIDYHGGQPLGRLLAAVSDQQDSLAGVSPLVRPIPIGLERSVTFERGGDLFLRVNDRPSALGDNRGELEVVIRPVR